VIKKDVANNTITVGPESELELASDHLTASDWHMVAPSMEFPLDAMSKIRYRQQDEAVHVESLGNNRISATFSRPLRAVTPGQTIAVYRGDELLGSAIID
jgi:tRNA-uridine 2-sulfurtransferase